LPYAAIGAGCCSSSRCGSSIPDLLVAAVAEVERLSVLHYDADFELVAGITGQLAEWVVPRGQRRLTVPGGAGSLATVTTGGPGREQEEAPLRRPPQLAVLLEGGDRKGLLHDMTAAIVDHGGDILSVEIVERGVRSAVYWELDAVQEPDSLVRAFREIDVVTSVRRLPSMFQVYGKRIIVVGAGAQVGQVALGAIGEADRHNIRGEKISVDTIPIVGEENLANAARAVARLPRAVALVLAGSLMGGAVTRAVDEVRSRGILVVSLNMAGSVPRHADLVVTDPVQAGVMAVMAVASTASFDIERVRGQRF
jgi:energy-converting hydrogenase B subunit Q